jgi:hypothetical protein
MTPTIYQLELEPNEPVPDLIDFIDETTPHRIETIEGHEFLYEFHPTEPHVYAKMPNGLILHGELDAWRVESKPVWERYYQLRKGVK